MKLRTVYALMATTAISTPLSSPAWAQAPTAPAAADPTQAPPATQAVPTQLDAVTTAAMRSRRPLDDVPATVSVITTENIDRENMQDVRDLVRNEPGVTVGNGAVVGAGAPW